MVDENGYRMTSKECWGWLMRGERIERSAARESSKMSYLGALWAGIPPPHPRHYTMGWFSCPESRWTKRMSESGKDSFWKKMCNLPMFAHIRWAGASDPELEFKIPIKVEVWISPPKREKLGRKHYPWRADWTPRCSIVYFGQYPLLIIMSRDTISPTTPLKEGRVVVLAVWVEEE
jgi:hypothetical protein